MQDDGVSVWIACLRDLKRLLSSSSTTTRGPDNSTSSQVLVDQILQNIQLVGPDALPVSVAAHARLVNDLKLPLHLCAACITAVGIQGAPEDRSCAIIAAYRTLTSYLHYFTVSKYDAITAAAGAAHAEDADPLKTVAAAVRSQIEQSGLLQHLPALLADATAALAAQTAQMAGAAADVRGPRQSRAPPKLSARTQHIAEQASVTANTFVNVFSLWPYYGLPMLKAAAASGPAALDLTMATMKFVNSLVQQQQKLPVGFGAVCQELMKGVRHMTMDLIQGGVLADGLSTCVQEISELQQVLGSAQYLPCIVLNTVLMAYGSVARQQEHLAAPTGSSSRKRAQANRELAQHELSLLQDRKEYVLACDLGLRLQQGLTKSELRLFAMLGVDATTMMWAAAAVRQHCQPAHLLQLQQAYYDRAVSWEQSITAGGKGRSAQQQQVVVVTPAEADFHLLLPCVLLHAVARIPETDSGFAVSCMYAGSICKAAARIWADLQESQQPGHLVWAQQYQAMAGVQFRFTKPDLMAAMPPEVVADVLPFLLDILRALLQQLQVPSASSSSLLARVHRGINPAEKEQRSALGQLTSFLCYLLLHSTKQQQQPESLSHGSRGKQQGRQEPACQQQQQQLLYCRCSC